MRQISDTVYGRIFFIGAMWNAERLPWDLRADWWILALPLCLFFFYGISTKGRGRSDNIQILKRFSDYYGRRIR